MMCLVLECSSTQTPHNLRHGAEMIKTAATVALLALQGAALVAADATAASSVPVATGDECSSS